jgi:hypothetical protein
MAWIVAPGLTMHRQTQAYSRLGHQLYVYENLDGSGFSAELAVDEGGIVLRHDKVAEGVIADKAEPPAAMPEPAGAIAKLDLAPALCMGRHHSAKLPSACRHTGLRQAWPLRSASRTAASSMSRPSRGPVNR